MTRMFVLFALVLMAGCATKEAPAADKPAKLAAAPGTKNFPKTRITVLCREFSETAESLVTVMVTNGWLYQGPLYNDGINCTATLWVCRDPEDACASYTKE